MIRDRYALRPACFRLTETGIHAHHLDGAFVLGQRVVERQLVVVQAQVSDRLCSNRFVEPRRAEEHVFQSFANRLGTQGLSAHRVMSVQGFDDSIHESLVQIG